ncbi:MAG TPA: S41 family peptidase [Longimicrobiales bacterium]|nr:S41 family peptidase [Longimicrobiales bacterium]
MLTKTMAPRRGLVVALLLAVAVPAAGQTRLLRFPDVHGDRVVFTHAGDLWTAPVSGGTAIRLTTHPGLELFAKFSPDGRSIAFTGQYDGDEQVYVMPATGGEPRQLTYYPARGPLAERWGYDHQVYGWSPDGQRVLFRSFRDSWTLPAARLYTVSAGGGPAEALPMPVAGSGAFSPDGNRVVYSPVFRDFRSEKRYSGGQANRLVIFDMARNTATPVPEKSHAQRDAMWIGDVVYYTSDEDGTFNIYSYTPATGATAQVTRSTQWDVRWPSADPSTGRIVYEMGGTLHVLDTRTGEARAISITVPDDGVASRPSRVAVGSQVSGFALSPKGERALFTARGDIFTAPIEAGPTRNLTNSSGSHEKHARWSPDGRHIVFISDRTGEEELWLMAQDGSGQPEQLTRGGSAFRYAPAWSPDGSRIAFSDKDGRLYVLTMDGRRLAEIADDPRGQIQDYTWSPRGNHLAFSMADPRGVRAVHVWSAADNRVRQVTDGFFGEWGPAWGSEGDYLYYLSNREYAPQLSNNEWNFAGNRSTRIYAMSLRRDVPHPFPPRSDEVTITAAEDGASGATAATSSSAAATSSSPTSSLIIEFDGIAERVVPVPVQADNYGGLSAAGGHLVYWVTSAGYYGRGGERQPQLRVFALADRRETTLSETLAGYALSQDGSKLLVREGGSFVLMDARPNGAASKKTVATSNMYVDRVPAQEWAQIFDEVWRRYRDFFYVENMHGYDWNALRDRYRPLLAHVGHRSDLNYVISEMIAELSVQHAYIAGGDWTTPSRPSVALPGARFEWDARAGAYRITKIFEGHNEEAIYRSPLTEPGVDAQVGEYVLAIDGQTLTADEDPYRLLRHRADRPVTLTLSRSGNARDGREVTFNPVTSEADLVYLDWVEGNRRRVDEMTNGRVGYIHVPNMGAEGIREFIKWYYPQIRREGLVIDVRANGGGNVSSMLIERLQREVLATGFSRTDDHPSIYPRMPTFHGSMVTILDENSASDGDIFPAMFREAGLGPLVGKRSWGGVVGITDRGGLIDGGVVNVPEFGFNSVTGEWIIEGYGVDPDIEVDQDPIAVLNGRDPQLERAVQEVERLMRENPRRLPQRPAPPVRTPDRR